MAFCFQNCSLVIPKTKWEVTRAVHRKGGGGGGGAVPARRTQFFLNIAFEFAELFLVAILIRNHKKIDWFGLARLSV